MSAKKKIVPGARRKRLIAVMIAFAVAFVGAAIWGLLRGYDALERIYDEQCRITNSDVDAAIVVTGSAKMIHPDLVTVFFGLTNGANLAEIDFAGKRAELLAKTPNIRDLRIERRLPNRVTVEVFEREPIARVAGKSRRAAINRVVDSYGVVFRFHRNIATLPIIRESAQPETQPGQKLSDSGAAALHLVQAVAAAPELGDFRILEIDTSPRDYLMLTMSNYSRAKIAWEHMGQDDARARTSLKRQLERLSQAMSSHITPGTTLWNAMDFDDRGRVYADDPTLSGRQKGT